MIEVRELLVIVRYFYCLNYFLLHQQDVLRTFFIWDSWLKAQMQGGVFEKNSRD